MPSLRTHAAVAEAELEDARRTSADAREVLEFQELKADATFDV